ncbi:MAG: BlaI family penicillinase repressor [Verrucomicrobiales bacterium]|jgi:BlaI family penicillinase repressor
MVAMKRKKLAEKKPTGAELELLCVLWDRGASTVREVHEALDEHKEVGYTTTLKLLQNMTEKGFCARDDSRRSHVYRAAVRRAPVQRRLVSEFLHKAFGGSSQALVMQVLSSKKSSQEEIDEIRHLLDRMEADQEKEDQ